MLILALQEAIFERQSGHISCCIKWQGEQGERNIRAVFCCKRINREPGVAALPDGIATVFLSEEAAARKQQGMPPFGRLAAIIVGAPDANQADMVASRIGRAAPDFDGVSVLR